jgi:multidrug efflux pump subunit AcrA (membrane-fusion protein)
MNEEREHLPGDKSAPSAPTPSQPVPKISGLALSAIVFLLVVTAALFGILAGPLITEAVSTWSAARTAQPAAEGEGHQHGAVEATASSWYVCTMHPWIVQPAPGVCPICIMDLTPLDPERFSAEIAIDPVVLQNIGVRVQPVVSGPVARALRTVGTVAYDETRFTDVNLKFEGWVETVHINSLGAPVRAGEPLLEIYAPELVASQEEYLLLWRNRAVPGNEQLLTSARRRLALFDLTDAQIAELEQRGAVRRTLSVHAPKSGIVIEKMVNPGLKVMPGMTLFRIADLRQVWVIATVYEHQLPLVAAGRQASVSLAYLPGKRFSGRIDYIYPYLDQKTREAQVRLVLANAGGDLKPGMFVDVEIASGGGNDMKVLAPREAVIDTGTRAVAFVSRGEGKFEPRTVRTGVAAGDGMIEILDGLQPGELVVTSGQFLIDSEARIRESLAKMLKGDLASEQMGGAEFAGDRIMLPAAAQQQLATVIDRYLGTQDALYAGSLAQAQAPARELTAAIQALTASAVPDNPHYWHENAQATALATYAPLVVSAKTLDEARTQFGHVGEALDQFLKLSGLPSGYGKDVIGLRCGMYEPAPQGGIWLQVSGQARNPFFGRGHGMQSCSTAKWNYPAAGSSPAQPAVDKPSPKAASRTESADVSASHSDAALELLLEAYLQTHEELYYHRTARLRELATMMDGALAKLGEPGRAMRAETKALASVSEIEAARAAFGRLGVAYRELIAAAGLPSSWKQPLVIKHCGMYPAAPEGGIWLQVAGDTRNPFFGDGAPMAACAPEEWPVQPTR